MNDRMIDDSVSKAQYMKILVNTIKDDLTKISGWLPFFIPLLYPYSDPKTASYNI